MATPLSPTCDHVPPTPAFSAGDLVGNYRLVRHIHAGSFGQVWLGHHILVPGNRRAVKVFSNDGLGTMELEGVCCYSRVANSQPGLVPVQEIGPVPDKGYYYTMPLADDVNGPAVVRDAAEYEPMTLYRYGQIHKPVPIDRVLGVALNLLPAVHALHEAGLVHRDIKPGNVVRVEGLWKLCDPGLVARRDEINGSGGTPGFTPPEGMTGRRADIYAFGVTLFVLATGRRANDLPAFMTSTLTIPGNDDRRDDLGRVIRQACHPDANQRYQTAMNMYVEINRLVRTTKLTVVLDDDFASFTPARLEEFVRAVRERGVHIHGIPVCAEGSVRITLELTPVDAEELAAAVQAGEFDHFRAVRVELAEPRAFRAERKEDPGRGVTKGPPGDASALSPEARPAPVSVDEEDLKTSPGPMKSEEVPPTDPPTVWPADRGYGTPSIRGYEVLDELGHGGLSVVYKARQLGTNRLVALKLLREWDSASKQAGQMFRRSVEALALVQHPNIAQIFEAGEHEGRHFCAIELCLGESLDQRLRRGPLGPAEAAGLVETLARAVEALHQAGAIHRDLKPRAVLFSGPTPKIVSFGLAAGLNEIRREERGSVVGTPSYMAPEQAQGDTRRIGPPADVWGLGAILYHCLTGRPPFQGATVLETLTQVRLDEPLPPTRLSSHLPRDLEAICLMCLQKDPAKRYASAADLAEDLRRFQHGEPIRARPAGPGKRLWRWLKRKLW